MATRFYFPYVSNAASVPVAYFDPNGTTDWDQWGTGATQEAIRPGPLVTTKLGFAGGSITGDAEVSSSTPRTGLLWRAISGPLSAQTISGNVKGQIRCAESNLAADMYVKVVIRLVDSNMQHKSYLYNSAPTGATEMTTVATNRRMFPGGSVALTSRSAAAGDRLVVEIGYYAANAVSTSYSGTVYINDGAGTDQPEDESTTTSSRDTWIEFDGTITLSSTQQHSEAVEIVHEAAFVNTGPVAGQLWPRGNRGI